ncbi:hypothetical protein [Thermococcus piezophilus]|uniref:Uncharacterized protein n=1 Tax=Thermococcus piezophilus TaxID=1712654 RepID=A0A172WF79_9EURY|nr:hypothetical protein [Thermococcus piezophilus]ANF22061.1 hypothetical protein A7C91_01795 [Thermococcus piezophilus]
MEFKAGAILASTYFIPLLLIAGFPVNEPTAGLIAFVYLCLSVILLVVTAFVAKFIFDIPLWPWGVTLVLGSLALIFLLNPVLDLIRAVWFIPPVVAFVIGITQG